MTGKRGKHVLLTGLMALSSQLMQAQDQCATPSPSLSLRRTYQAVLNNLPVRSARRETALTYLPVRFHVVRRDNGADGADNAAINRAMVLINQQFQPGGIAFYVCGAVPDYINNSRFFDFDEFEEAAMTNNNDVPNAINIYVTNTISYNGNQTAGYGYFPAPLAITNRIFVTANRLATNTLVHELGHYFGLYHTFEGNANAAVSERELVIRPGDVPGRRTLAPNCTDTGDFLCDTPADPYGLPGATSAGCAYTALNTDANGDRYTPATNNIMGYNVACGTQFTPGQYQRMAAGLQLRLSPANAYSLTCTDPLSSAPTGLSATMTPAGVALRFTANSTNVPGFLLERATGPTGTFGAIGTVPPMSTSFVDGALTSRTTYQYRVKPANSASQYSPVATISTGIFYCIPRYDWPIGGFVPRLDDFSMAGSQSTLRSVSTGAGPAGYSDFTAISHPVRPGQVYSFTASAAGAGVRSYMVQHLSVWLDSDQNGTFADTEQLFQSSATNYLRPSLTGTLQMPTTLPTGPMRLRVRTQYWNDGVVSSACAPYNYGETEDYTLQADTLPPPPCFTLTAAATPANCFGKADGSIVLAIRGGTGPFSYSIANRSTSTGYFADLPAGVYSATATDGSDQCSQTLSVTVGQPAATSLRIVPESATLCQGASLTLLASGASQYQWLGGGNDAALSVLASGTYTVRASDPAGCTATASARVQVVTCPVSVTHNSVSVRLKVFLEGYLNPITGLMHSTLTTKKLLPSQQPYATAPWAYTGTEQLTTDPATVCDWVLLMARTPAGQVIQRKAAVIRPDGLIVNPDGTEGVVFTEQTGPIVVSVHHRSHLAILTATTVVSGQLIDFSTQPTAAKGAGQLKTVGGKWAMPVGDYDGNNVINNQDFNRWKATGAAIGQYVPADGDGNGVVNNLDYNRWVLNRSLIGTPGL